MSNDDLNKPDQDQDGVDLAVAEASEEAVSELCELDSLKAQLEEAQQALSDHKDQTLRTVAEAQNIKRRAEKDVISARKFALEKFASEMLIVADNLERAVDAADIDNAALKPLLEGVELTQKSFTAGLQKFNVELIDPAGEPFDPQFHQAMSIIENPDVEPNTVLQVMQKGYTLSGRLLRPAMVMVSKAVSAPVDESA